MAAAIRWLGRWGGAALDFLYPPTCPLCYRRLHADDRAICVHCTAAMRLEGAWRCGRCGAAGLGAEPRVGGKCRLCPPDGAAWNGALAPSGYFDLSSNCIDRFKYHRRREIGEAMAAMMATELPRMMDGLRDRLDVVAPVPIHWGRRMRRGFNQSDVLAERLAAALGLPYRRNLLRRSRHTRQQALLPRERRADNVRGAFRVRRDAELRGTGVLLVDDVVTTGETIGECARVLREAGAREVWVAAFARAGAGGPDRGDDLWLQDLGPIIAPPEKT
jgi:ComF family protein